MGITEINATDTDFAVQDGIIVICDDCGDEINDVTGACHPYCPNMLGDQEIPEGF